MTHSAMSTSTVDSDVFQPPTTTTSSLSTIPVIDKATLPRSVRGAPAELRRAIRRKQNSESARRCRARRRLERSLNAATTAPTVRVGDTTPVVSRIAHLEAVVKSLSEQLIAAQTQYASLLASQCSSTPVKDEPVTVFATPTSPVNVQQISDDRNAARRSAEEFLSTIDQLAEL